MKRSLPIIAIAIITLLGTTALQAQRRGDRDGTRGNERDRWENRDRRDRDDRRDYQDFNRRGDRRGNDRYVVRNGRKERVVNHRRVRYDGYGNYGYPARPRRGYSQVWDYDYRNGRRFRINRAPRPTVRHIWVPGHWRYSRRFGHDVWVRGGWAVKSRNHRWVDGHYERYGGRRTWVPGCWSVIY